MGSSILRPSAAGDYTQFTPFGGGVNWQKVMDGLDSTYNWSTTSGQRDQFEIDNLPAEADSIVGDPILKCRARGDGFSEVIDFWTKIDGSDGSWAAEVLTSSWQTILRTIAHGPGWTVALINSMQIGYRAQFVPLFDGFVNAADIWLEVNWAEAVSFPPRTGAARVLRSPSGSAGATRTPTGSVPATRTPTGSVPATRTPTGSARVKRSPAVSLPLPKGDN
jgi:hypothetical protein